MPYKRIGKIVYKIVDGKLVKKGESKTIEEAKKYLRLLQSFEKK